MLPWELTQSKELFSKTEKKIQVSFKSQEINSAFSLNPLSETDPWCIMDLVDANGVSLSYDNFCGDMA